MRVLGTAWVTVNGVVTVVVPWVAVRVVTAVAATGTVVTDTLADVWPAGIVTEAGMDAA